MNIKTEISNENFNEFFDESKRMLSKMNVLDIWDEETKEYIKELIGDSYISLVTKNRELETKCKYSFLNFLINNKNITLEAVELISAYENISLFFGIEYKK